MAPVFIGLPQGLGADWSHFPRVYQETIVTTSQVLHSQPSSAPAGVAGQDLCTLAAGSARSLRPTAAMQLRVVSGQAWVTLGDGPHGWREESGDTMLQAGQSVRVSAGQHAVVEPLGHQPLQFQWRSAGAAPAAGQRPAALQRDACCA